MNAPTVWSPNPASLAAKRSFQSKAKRPNASPAFSPSRKPFWAASKRPAPFLHRPYPELGGRRQLDAALTELGGRSVERVLYSIEHELPV